MAKVFNPIYDTVFKYLMEDNKVAKVLLGGILEKKITDISVLSHEHIMPSKDELKLMRIDFAATIVNSAGEKETVTIELQKAYAEEEVMRFRKYLGLQYQSDANADVVMKPLRNGETREILVPRHIFTIYILGHSLGKGYEYPIMKGETVFKDINDCVIHFEKPCKFADGVTHHTYIIQIPHLPERPKKPLEKMLRIFDQRYKIDKDGRYLDLEEDQEKNSDFNLIFMRLLKGTVDDKLRGDLDFEEEMERQYHRNRMDLEDAKLELGEVKEQLAAKESQLAERENQLAAKESQLAAMIEMSASFGISPEQIAAKLNISIAEVKTFLGK